MIRSVFSFALAAMIAMPAAADVTSGKWAFRTDIADKGCTITGTMEIGPPVDGETSRACRFVSTEICGPSDLLPATMEQSCRVIWQSNFLLIRSEVVSSLTEGVNPDFYMPDHFTLTETSATEMSGTWYDRLYRDAVRFWRPTPIPVS